MPVALNPQRVMLNGRRVSQSNCKASGSGLVQTGNRAGMSSSRNVRKHTRFVRIKEFFQAFKDRISGKDHANKQIICNKFNKDACKDLKPYERQALANYIKAWAKGSMPDLDNMSDTEVNTIRNLLAKVLTSKVEGFSITNNRIKINGQLVTNETMKQQAKECLNLYKKYVDSNAFPKSKEAEVDPLSLGLQGTDVDTFNYLKRFVESEINDKKLAIFAKIFSANENFPSYNPKPLINDFKEYNEDQLQEVLKLAKENPDMTYDAFKEKCTQEILKKS